MFLRLALAVTPTRLSPLVSPPSLPEDVCPTLPGSQTLAPAPGRGSCSGRGQGHLDGCTCAEQPPGPAAAARAPPATARAPNARKANKDVLVSALLEAQEGGNQCLVNGKRENRSGKTVYFQAGEGFVNSTGHCGGSTAGYKTPRAEECSLSEPAGPGDTDFGTPPPG